MANELREPEKTVAIRKIRRLMAFWDISPHELRGVTRPAVRQAPPAPCVRYGHPVSGETWDGEGTQPHWLRVALTSEGYTVEQLRATPAAGESPEAGVAGSSLA